MKSFIKQIDYVAITNYNAVKDIATTEDKDLLLYNLLIASYMHDYSNSEAPLCEEYTKITNEWATLQNQKQDYSEILNLYLSSFFPKACGKIGHNELILLRNIKQLSPGNIKLGLLCYRNSYEIWIISKTRDYNLLEEVSGLVIKYEGQTGMTANCVWATEEKMQQISEPQFILTM